MTYLTSLIERLSKALRMPSKPATATPPPEPAAPVDEAAPGNTA